MKRKVAQIGPSTLMVSLPSKWVKANKVRKGDELDVNLNKSDICFSNKTKEKTDKEITVDISNYEKYFIGRYLETLYISNYDYIKLIHSKPTVFDYKTNKGVNVLKLIKKRIERYIGMEIISQTSNQTELRCFLLNEERDPNKIEKRIFYLIKDAFDEFLASLDNNYPEYLDNVQDYHANITKFITYYLRVLNSSDKSEDEKLLLYSLYCLIDKIIDKFRHLNEAIEKYGCSKRIKLILVEQFNLFMNYFDALHKRKFSGELSKQRYGLKWKIDKSNYTLNEFKVISEIKILLDITNEFCRVIIVKDLLNDSSL